MDYTIDTTDLASINAVAGKASYANQAAGTLSLDLAMDDIDAVPVPWQYGDRLTLTQAGRTIFAGTVTSVKTIIGHPDYIYRVTVQDDWWILEHTTYAKFVNTDSGGHATSGGFAGLSSANSDAKTASLKDVVDDIVGWATAMRADCKVYVDAMTIPFATNGSDSCAALLKSSLKWQPDVITRMTYRGDQVSLGVQRLDTLGHVWVSLADLEAESIEMTARPDLVPPVCALIGKYGDYILPAGGDIRTPCAFVYAAPPDNYTSSNPGDLEAQAQSLKPYLSNKIIHLGVKAPVASTTGQLDDRYAASKDARKFWARIFPELKDMDDVQYGITALQSIDDAPDEFAAIDAATGEATINLPPNYSTTLTSRYALVSGQFSGNNRHVRFNYSTVYQCARIPLSVVDAMPAAKRDQMRSWFPADDIDDDGVRYLKRLMSCRFCNISHARGWERSDQSDSGEGDLPADDDDNSSHDDDTVDYHAVLDDYYRATRVVPWEGTCRAPLGLPGYDACDLVGWRLHITGGRSEWRTMDATIQTAELDLMTGAVSITCGACGHLSFDEYAQLRELARLRDGSTVSPKPAPLNTPDDPDDPDKDSPVTIAPFFAANDIAFSGGGMQLGAFTPYRRSDGYWWVSGGIVQVAPGQIVTVPPTRVGGNGKDMIYAVTSRNKDGSWRVQLKRKPLAE